MTQQAVQLTLLESNRLHGISASDLNLVEQEYLICLALDVLNVRYRPGERIESSQRMKDYLRLRFSELEYEVFSVVLLDTRHRILCFSELFRGTVDGASVYPREVVKIALQHNAAACLLTHNHPSGIPEPSNADKKITQRLKEALALIDVRVLDHIIVAQESTVSLAERGLI